MQIDLRRWQKRYRWYWRHRGLLQGTVAGLLFNLFLWALWGRVFLVLVAFTAFAAACWQDYRHRGEHGFMDALDRQAGLEQQLLAWYESRSVRPDNPFLRPLARRVDAHLRPMLGREVFPLHWWPESVLVVFLAVALGAGLSLPAHVNVGLLTYSDTLELTSEPTDELEPSAQDEQVLLESDLPGSDPNLEADSLDTMPQELPWEQSSQDYAIARDRASRLVEEFAREIPSDSSQTADAWSVESADPLTDEGEQAVADEERDRFWDEEGEEIGLQIDGMESDPEDAEFDDFAEGGDTMSGGPDDDLPDPGYEGPEGGNGSNDHPDPADSDSQQSPPQETDSDTPLEDGSTGNGGAGSGEGSTPFGDNSDLVPEGGEFFDAQLEGTAREDDWLLFIMEELGALDPDIDAEGLENRMLSYRQELMNQVEQETIPLRHRSWIRDYFSLLTAN